MSLMDCLAFLYHHSHGRVYCLLVEQVKLIFAAYQSRSGDLVRQHVVFCV